MVHTPANSSSSTATAAATHVRSSTLYTFDRDACVYDLLSCSALLHELVSRFPPYLREQWQCKGGCISDVTVSLVRHGVPPTGVIPTTEKLSKALHYVLEDAVESVGAGRLVRTVMLSFAVGGREVAAVSLVTTRQLSEDAKQLIVEHWKPHVLRSGPHGPPDYPNDGLALLGDSLSGVAKWGSAYFRGHLAALIDYHNDNFHRHFVQWPPSTQPAWRVRHAG